MQIPIYYDPMIAKLIVHAPTRIEAIQKMKQVIRDYRIEGVSTTLPFGAFVMDHEAFVTGHFDTHFVKNHYTPEHILENQRAIARMAALVDIRHWQEHQKKIRLWSMAIPTGNAARPIDQFECYEIEDRYTAGETGAR
jgi:acetyl/propionyl-CoA carboxylase alpha subunit